MPRRPDDSLRPRATRPFALAAPAVCLALALAACGDSDDEAAVDTSTAPAQTSAGGGGGKDDAKPASDPSPARGPELLGDRGAARAGVTAVDDVYGGLRAAVEAGVTAKDTSVVETLDSAGGAKSLTAVCDLMSEEARRRTIVYAQRSAGLADVDWTCEKATGLLLRRSVQRGDPQRVTRAKVIGVNAEGDRATATVRFGGRKGRLTTISLVKEEGKWKLASAPGGG